MKRHILVVLSGGQDSLTCLGLALKQRNNSNFETKISAISFDYNQKHKVELAGAASVCSRYGVPHKIVELGPLLSSLVTSALTGDGAVGLPHAYKPGLPSSFVPGRNALFLTLAHAHAQEIAADTLLTGVCQTDYSGYPDCRDSFIRCLESALNIGYETRIGIGTPLMWLTKSETFAMAAKTDFLDVILHESHTCYNGDHSTWNDFGFGCGTCPACELRKKGYAEFETAMLEAGQEGTQPFPNLNLSV